LALVFGAGGNGQKLAELAELESGREGRKL
jgi:hypothetical protein